MNKKDIKFLIALAIITCIFIGAFVIIDKVKNSKKEPAVYLKNYGVNEYIPTYVSDESMAKIYLNDYINSMIYDTESAYYSINEEYRNIKFPSYQDYYNYVSNLSNYDMKLAKFYKKSADGYVIFGVYDQYNNFYGFKTKGVLQYTVYLDEDTIEIW